MQVGPAREAAQNAFGVYAHHQGGDGGAVAGRRRAVIGVEHAFRGHGRARQRRVSRIDRPVDQADGQAAAKRAGAGIGYSHHRGGIDARATLRQRVEIVQADMAVGGVRVQHGLRRDLVERPVEIVDRDAQPERGQIAVAQQRRAAPRQRRARGVELGDGARDDIFGRIEPDAGIAVEGIRDMADGRFRTAMVPFRARRGFRVGRIVTRRLPRPVIGVGLRQRHLRHGDGKEQQGQETGDMRHGGDGLRLWVYCKSSTIPELARMGRAVSSETESSRLSP